MANESTQKTSRKEIPDSIAYLNEQEAGLFLFQNVGDKVKGIVQAGRLVPTEIEGVVKKDVKGNPKRHLQLLVNSDDGEQEWVVNVQSQNQKEALRKAVADAGTRGVAPGDEFEMEYTHDDTPLREGLTGARGYNCVIVPA